MSELEILSFPCEVPVKIMGRNGVAFRDKAMRIVQSHIADFDESGVTETRSNRGRFLSLTVIVLAASREQLDNLYRELTASDDVLMVL